MCRRTCTTGHFATYNTDEDVDSRIGRPSRTFVASRSTTQIGFSSVVLAAGDDDLSFFDDLDDCDSAMRMCFSSPGLPLGAPARESCSNQQSDPRGSAPNSNMHLFTCCPASAGGGGSRTSGSTQGFAARNAWCNISLVSVLLCCSMRFMTAGDNNLRFLSACPISSRA